MDKKGIVKAISIRNNSVLVDEVWFHVGDNVKLSYLKKGEVEFKTEINDLQEEFIVFIKNTGTFSQSAPSQNFSPAKSGFSKPIFKENSPDYKDELMSNMSAAKSAASIFEGTGKVEEFKNLTEEIKNFIFNGKWN